MKGMNDWLRRVCDLAKLEEWWKVPGVKLTGHYRRYGISGNLHGIRQFHNQTVKRAYKWINRRSQKKSYAYRCFRRFVEYNPLPKPELYHLIYTLSPYPRAEEVFLKSRMGEILKHGSVRRIK